MEQVLTGPNDLWPKELHELCRQVCKPQNFIAMKNTFWCLLFFFSLGLGKSSAQSIAGVWVFPQNGVRLTLSEPDAQGYGQYYIQYPNGMSNQNAYLLQGSAITFAAFNYGQDQTFAITGYDGQQLGLQSQNPPQNLVLQRESAAGNAYTNQTNATGSGAVLASQSSYQLTEGHWQAALQFARFVLGTQLSTADEHAFRQSLIEEFNANPQATLTEIESLASQMQQLYQLTDLSQIALSRNMLLAALYQNFEQQAQKTYFYTLMQKYAPIIQIDPATGLALTWRDVDGYLGLMAFYSELAGQPLQISDEDRITYAQYLSQQFAIADQQTKASICTMATLNEYLRAAFAQLSPAEQQQAAAQLLQGVGYQGNYNYQGGYQNDYYDQQFQQGYNQAYEQNQNLGQFPDGIDTPEKQRAYLQEMQTRMQTNNMMFNTMQNIMTQQHATSLNIIENMGNSGNYWEVTYDNNY